MWNISYHYNVPKIFVWVMNDLAGFQDVMSSSLPVQARVVEQTWLPPVAEAWGRFYGSMGAAEIICVCPDQRRCRRWNAFLFLRLVSRDLYWCCWQYHVLVTLQCSWSLYKTCRLTGLSAVFPFHCIHVASITCTIWTVYILCKTILWLGMMSSAQVS